MARFFSPSTSVFPGEWLFQGSSGYMFLAPDSTAATNNGLAVADLLGGSTEYSGIFLSPKVISGTATGPEILYSYTRGLNTALFYNGNTYSALVTNLANYLYIEGNSSGSAPGIQALGVDTNIDIQVLPKGSGVLMFNYAGTTMGGGATATLGSIGGSGPTAAGQAIWLKIKIGATIYYLPAWST